MADNQSTMTVRIVSIDFDVEIEGQKNKYQGTEVTYKTRDGKTNTKGLHNSVFKYNKSLREDLEALTKGDYAEITYKKEGDFVNWVSAKRVERPAEAAAPAEQTKETAAPATKERGTYNDFRETPEERAARQVMIVRQSSLSTAVAMFAANAKAGSEFLPGADEVIAVAQEFEAYVLGTTAKKEVARPIGHKSNVAGFEDFPDDPV